MLLEIENLLRLQEADKEIRRLQDEVAELPKRVAVIERKLANTQAQLEKAQGAVKADEAARRKYDTTITDLRGKISKYRDQSLDVKTNEQSQGSAARDPVCGEGKSPPPRTRSWSLMVNADARDKEVKAAQAESEAPRRPKSKKRKLQPASAPPKMKNNSPNGGANATRCARA